MCKKDQQTSVHFVITFEYRSNVTKGREEGGNTMLRVGYQGLLRQFKV